MTAESGARRIPRVLSIAGSDPSGGAGIQADLKSIAATGGYGMAAITALTAQNTVEVRGVHAPPPGFLRDQLDAVGGDVVIDAVKVGMLFDEPIVRVVADWLREVRPPVVVLDPVMVAASGGRLLRPGAEDAVRELLAAVDLITPNLAELAVLVGEDEAEDWPGALEQAMRLSAAHGVRVLAKGGHLPGPTSPDALVDAACGRVTEFPGRRIATRHTHGTGCSLSSGVATIRARTGDWETAVREAKAWLATCIAAADALEVGRGGGPVSHFASLWSRAERVRPGA
ncbi:MAG: bifunctional hydroxymethylpyrimidine kinase/phosphomethylpyrimidine kinase [Microbacterium sp.]